MGRIIEGVWDCRYCGAKKVRGGLRDCPQCGHPRDEGVTFYIDNPKNYVYDESKAAKARRGPDWTCSACNCFNSADDTVCIGCGTPRDSKSKDYFQTQEALHEKLAKQMRDKEEQLEARVETYQREETDWQAYHPEYQRKPEPTYTPPKKSINWRNIVIPVLSVLLVIAMIAGLVSCLSPREVSGTVMDMEWERSIEVEEYKTVRETDWSIPPGGREISRSEEIHHYDSVFSHYETKTRTYTEQVLDHYEEYVSGYRDLGNGHFEEITSQRPVYRTETKTETYEEPVYKQVPVYQTKYVYDIEKWVHQSYKKTSGEDKAPYWSDYECKDKERFGSRSETYTITVQNEDGEAKDYTLSFEQWNTLTVGQEVKMKADVFGNAELIFEEETNGS